MSAVGIGSAPPADHRGSGGAGGLAALPVTGRRLAAVPDGAAAPGVLRVTVTGADADDRARLAALLIGQPGVEVVGWPDPFGSPAVQGSSALLSVVVDAEQHRAVPPVTPADTARRPRLSARQREVLAAYGSGNDLLPVVARRLGMAPETVKTHLRRIRSKYEEAGRSAPTRRDLYVRALEDGVLVSPR